MGQRGKILTQITGFRGWKVAEAYWEDSSGRRVYPIAGYDIIGDAVLVLRMVRRWTARCPHCLGLCTKCHERRKPRRWKDLPWAGRRVVIEYAPERIKCKRCGSHGSELLVWADPKQRQTRRLQQHLALDAFSMPLSHVSSKYGLSWHTIRRAEFDAIRRWEQTCPAEPLRMVGVDEKYLGRRNNLPEDFVTIVSNLESGRPLWIGYGRSSATLKSWLDTLTVPQKAVIQVFAMDMHEPYRKAVQEDSDLAHADIAHDPFHVMKRAGEAVTDLRRQVFFRAGGQLRAVGRGTRWLVLKAWERTNEEERGTLRRLFSYNGKLARAYRGPEDWHRCVFGRGRLEQP